MPTPYHLGQLAIIQQMPLFVMFVVILALAFDLPGIHDARELNCHHRFDARCSRAAGRILGGRIQFRCRVGVRTHRRP